MSSVRLKKVTSRVIYQSYNTLSNWNDLKCNSAAVSWQTDSKSLQLLLFYMYSRFYISIYKVTKLIFQMFCIFLLLSLCGNHGGKKITCWSIWWKNKKLNDKTLHNFGWGTDGVKYLSISLNFCVCIFVDDFSNTVTIHEFLHSCLIFHSSFSSHLMSFWDKHCTLNFSHCTKLGSWFCFCVRFLFGWGSRVGAERGKDVGVGSETWKLEILQLRKYWVGGWPGSPGSDS